MSSDYAEISGYDVTTRCFNKAFLLVQAIVTSVEMKRFHVEREILILVASYVDCLLRDLCNIDSHWKIALEVNLFAHCSQPPQKLCLKVN